MAHRRSFVRVLMSMVAVSVALVLPLSGVASSVDAAIDQSGDTTPQSIEQMDSQSADDFPRDPTAVADFVPVSGSVNPNAGSTAGGTTVTVALDNPPALVGSAHGTGFGLAITDTGAVATWGAGTSGQLGNGDSSDSITPILLAADQFGGQEVTQVAAGKHSSYALTAEGSLYAWGAVTQLNTPNLLSQLPLDSAVVQLTAVGEWAYLRTELGTVVAVPENGAPIVLFDEQTTGGGAAEVAASSTNVVVLTDSGELWTADTADLSEGL